MYNYHPLNYNLSPWSGKEEYTGRSITINPPIIWEPADELDLSWIEDGTITELDINSIDFFIKLFEPIK